MIVKNNKLDAVPGHDDFNFVSWDDKYLLGIPLIDNQHKELIRLTNELHQACLNRNQEVEAVFKGAMSRMVEYVHFHFGAEQELLQKIGYPDYHNHKKQHDSLIRDILLAVKDYSEGKKFVPNHFVRTLKDWIFSHIAVYDKIYASYIADQMKKGLISDEQLRG